MKRFFLIATLFFAILSGLNAQSIGNTWLLSKVEITETTISGSTHKEIATADTNSLLDLMGPKEVIFLSDDKLSYKRMSSDSFETFLYTKAGKTLAIELSECLLKLYIEAKKSKMQLSENKKINEDHTITIIYSYTKQ